jgi:hypothetical protein
VCTHRSVADPAQALIASASSWPKKLNPKDAVSFAVALFLRITALPS